LEINLHAGMLLTAYVESLRSSEAIFISVILYDRVQSLLTGGTQAGSSDQGSESDQETSGQSWHCLNRGGRPQNWFRRTHIKESYAEGHHNRKKLQCLHCDQIVESRVDYPQNHCLIELKIVQDVV